MTTDADRIRRALGGDPRALAARLVASVGSKYAPASASVRRQLADALREMAGYVDKAAALGNDLRASLEEARGLNDILGTIHAHHDHVWRWMGDGSDEPASLSCPVVMSADTLRAMLARAERAEAIAAAERRLRKSLHVLAGDPHNWDERRAAEAALRALGVEP